MKNTTFVYDVGVLRFVGQRAPLQVVIQHHPSGPNDHLEMTSVTYSVVQSICISGVPYG